MAHRNTSRAGSTGAPTAHRGPLVVGTIATAFVVVALVAGLFGSAAAARPGASTFAAVAPVPAAYPPNPFSTGMPESLVVGQTTFTTSTSGTTATTMSDPVAATFDASGDLWVVDRGNNRVLEYVPPFTDGEAASVVLGQASFTTSAVATTATGLNFPSGVIAGPAGSIWVADSENNRVLEYLPPFTSGMAASLVLGQSTFTTSTAAATAAGEAFPNSFAWTSTGDLFLVDYGNNRVLEYAPPFTSGEAATLVLGQASLTTNTAATSSTGMDGPIGIVIDAAGDLFVSGNLNNRVLEFVPPFTTGMAASVVLGQSSFTAGGAATTATGMSSPCEVVVTAQGDLMVADQGNSRVLEFRPPFVTGMAAYLVLGQTSFTSGGRATTQAGLALPYGVALDAQGDLWAADTVNDRAVEFSPSKFSVQFVESGLPYNTHWSVTFGGAAFSSSTNEISFVDANGSYAWSVGPISGYQEAPGFGTTDVNGTNVTATVAFVSTSSPSPSLLWPVVTSVLAVVIVIDTALVVWLLARGRRAGTRPPPQPVPPASPPPGAGGSPPSSG